MTECGQAFITQTRIFLLAGRAETSRREVCWESDTNNHCQAPSANLSLALVAEVLIMKAGSQAKVVISRPECKVSIVANQRAPHCLDCKCALNNFA